MFSNTTELLFCAGVGTCSGTGGKGDWICQHRWVAFTGMVGFRNHVGSVGLSDWYSQNSQIAFGRGLFPWTLALNFLFIGRI